MSVYPFGEIKRWLVDLKRQDCSFTNYYHPGSLQLLIVGAARNPNIDSKINETSNNQYFGDDRRITFT